MNKMKIKAALVEEFEKRFSSDLYHEGDDERSIVFPSKHAEIGNVVVWDDEYEATVEIQKITHGHFDIYDDSISEDEKPQLIAKQVADFLTELFADRVLFWVSPIVRSGGWRMLKSDSPSDYMKRKNHNYLWSGPIE